MSKEGYLIQARYKDYTVEVWPVESFTKVKGKTVYVFDILINNGYWGTCFTMMELEQALTRLRTRIERGEWVWEP